jgi:hypothetical protein
VASPSTSTIAIAIAMAIALAGCTVARPGDLTTRLWACDEVADCLDGWGCADRSVLGDDFCRPACDVSDPSSCDGACTRTGECLARCTIEGDTTTECPDGHTCVRSDLLGDDGVCFPADGCSRSSECGEGMGCLNDVFDLPSTVPGLPYSADHLYCVAVPDASERCATGYLPVPSDGSGSAYCLPRCDSAGSRCPPVLTCLRGMGYLFAHPGASPCYPGYWGLPCDDDAQCIVGRCLDIGGGARACTHSCEEAAALFPGTGGGCTAVQTLARGLRLDAVIVGCQQIAESRICVPLGTPGAPCNEDTLCAAGLECRTFGEGTTEQSFCTRACTVDADCDYPTAPVTAYCARDPRGGNLCLPRSYEGGACARAEHCRPGLTCVSARCVPVVP